MFKLLNKLRNHFIPHKENNFKPNFFNAEKVLAIIVVLFCVEIAYVAQFSITSRDNSYLSAVLPGVLTLLTNDTRRLNNLSPVVANDLLVEAANKKAQDMASKGYFSHVSPDGKIPWYWLDLVGYKYGYAGENLAINFNESNDVLNAWMQSPTHKANIVKKEYTEVGIGTAQGFYQGRSATFVVQYFATPVATTTTATTSAKNIR